MSKNKTKRFLEISFALVLVIALSSHAFIYQALAIQWLKIFQESRQWQIASDATLTALYPDADGSDSDRWLNEGETKCNQTNCYLSVDDDPDSHDSGGTEIHNSGSRDVQQFFTLSNTDGDFDSMNSATVDVVLAKTGTLKDDTLDLYVQLFESDETTALTSEVLIGNWNTDFTPSYVKYTKTLTITGTNDKTTWDGATLSLRVDYIKSGGGDNLQVLVTAIEIDGDYSTGAANTAPTIEAVSLQGTGVTTINLVEGSTVDIMASAQITDQEGCTDVRDGGGVKAIVYLYNEQNASCSQDNNNCYDEDIASCSWESTSGNTCYYQCTASSAMYFYADPTVSGGGIASKADEEWAVTIIASDSYWEDVTSNSWDPGASGSSSAEVALLLGLDVSTGGSDSIAYGNLNPGQDSDDTGGVLERGVKNTGNRPMNPLIQQTTALTKGSDTISADHQQFANTSFTVGNGTSLSASNQTLDLELPQRTDDTGASESDDQLFWGIYVPTGQAPGNYNGTTTYTADAD